MVWVFETKSPDRSNGLSVRCSIAEITVEGVVLLADTYCLDPAMHSRSEGVGKIIPSRDFEQVIVDSVLRCGAALQQLSVPFPWRLGVSLLRIGGYRMYNGSPVLRPTIDDRQDIIADPVFIRDAEEVLGHKALARVLKHTFDYVWRECGATHSLNYDREDNWRRPF
jgi:hypothetical protein